ncbi:uncharacterized protein LOC131035829 [Cryptomeria japonica]|uniref:uncharacterized protein LOC131035829 n=1 Tax=Cryptomeria japonica TaxID=3369 RepID=UPI0025ACAA8D|nr:uncharacterized protein LOC131035829 [Cryptomeria japonica]
MARNESSSKAHMFDGTNYAFWSRKMETYMSSLGFDIWMSVNNGYIVPSTPPTDLDTKWEYKINAKAKNVILSGMFDIEFVKVMHCTLAKTWDKIQRLYDGDTKVKEAKLQNLRTQFENWKIKEEEKLAIYLQRVDEIVSTIIGLGEEVIDEFIVKKVMRSLTTRYDTKVSAIEEAKDLKSFSMDELFGFLSTYEMRTVSVEVFKREVAFNTTQKGKEQATNEDENDSDATVAKFVRKLKRSSRKYKGKLPFKCFNYGKIGHFSSKCPYGEKDEGKGKDEKLLQAKEKF